MFYTPDQREALDGARAKKSRVAIGGEKQERQEEQPPAPLQPEIVTYGGIVRRSDGSSTVWINSRPVSDKDKASAPVLGQVRPDGRVTVHGTQTGRSVDLKVG